MGIRHTVDSKMAEWRGDPMLWVEQGLIKNPSSAWSFASNHKCPKETKEKTAGGSLTSVDNWLQKWGPLEGSTDLPLDSRDTNAVDL